MRLSRRTTRHLICLTSLLAFASMPLLAQTGIDLLDPEQVRRAGAQPLESGGTTTVRAVLDEGPTGLLQATHVRDTLRYDDGEFENFAQTGTHLEPGGTLRRGLVEWAQRFEVEADSTVVSARVCFLRPENDLSRAVDFKLRFYSNVVEDRNRLSNPGQRSGLLYNIASDIRLAGDHRCLILRGALVGKPLAKGLHWVGIEWNTETNKRLGGDHYTSEDEAEPDRSGRAIHETEVRYRHLPLLGGETYDGWTDAQVTQTDRGLKAIGVSLVVERTHAPDPPPGPTPGPGPDPGPAPDSACSDGLCLLENDRFRVRARYAMPGMSGQAAGTVAAGLGGAAGLFTFGGDHPELLVRLVDDCSGSGYYGLYTGAATDADYSLAVRDTMTGDLKWFRGLGGASIRDAMAFPCNN